MMEAHLLAEKGHDEGNLLEFREDQYLEVHRFFSRLRC